MDMKTLGEKTLFHLSLAGIFFLGLYWIMFVGRSNPSGLKTIGEIDPPSGYERVNVGKGSFGEFLREFPLKGKGSRVRYYNGYRAIGQYLSYAVLDLQMISPIEQCADAVMRLRSEYLFHIGDRDSIRFRSVGGEDMVYGGSPDRGELYKYLRKVYDRANTSSLRREMLPRSFGSVSPGDVLVYAAPSKGRLGHAVLVADVAEDPVTGKKALLLVQSSTPARTAHVLRNVFRPWDSPWVIVDGNSEGVSISGIRFRKDDLRTWR